MKENEKKFSANEKVNLFQDTGVQFLDFDVDLLDVNIRELYEICCFTKDSMHLCEKVLTGGVSLDKSAGKNEYEDMVTFDRYPGSTSFEKIELDDVLKAFEKRWIPLPYYMSIDNAGCFAEEPLNWCRCYFRKIADYKYKMVLAFDTTVKDSAQTGLENHLLQQKHINNGSEYRLCHNFSAIYRFASQSFFTPTLQKYWEEYAEEQEFSPKKIENGKTDKVYVGYYQAFLRMLAEPRFVVLPRIKMDPFNDKKAPVDVSLVLDIGNSRVYGLILEELSQNNM